MFSNETTPLLGGGSAAAAPAAASTSSDGDRRENRNFSCFRMCSRLSTGGAIIILISTNIFLFLQLQAVTIQVATNTNDINTLQEHLQQTETETQLVNEKVEQTKSLTIIHMAGTFVLLTCLITMFHMTTHLRKFNQPDIQRRIVAMLWMPPIYGVASFLSLCFPTTHEYMMILKDFYEAYCIYQFLSFLIAVLGKGSRDVVINVLAKHVEHLDKPYRCLQCFFHPPPTESSHAMSKAVLLECQILAMQFVFIKPLTGIITFAIGLAEDYDGGSDEGYYNTNDDNTTTADDSRPVWLQYLLSPTFWIVIIQNFSVFFAFAGLLKFYHAVNEELQWCQPFSKFLCIKGVVFMTFWQGLLISIFVGLKHGNDNNSNNDDGNDNGNDGDDETQRNLAVLLQNILICLEMLFFSLAHFCVFPTDEWEDGYRPRQMHVPGMAFKEFADDVTLVLDHTSRGMMVQKTTAARQRKNPTTNSSS